MVLNLQNGCAAVITFEGRPPWQTEPMTRTEWASALQPQMPPDHLDLNRTKPNQVLENPGLG